MKPKLMIVLSLVLLLVPVTLAAAEGSQDTRGGVAFVNGGEIDWVDPPWTTSRSGGRSST